MREPLTLTVAILRFAFGAIAAFALLAFFATLCIELIPLWFVVTFPLAVGALAVVYGDPFLERFLRVFRWLA